jgi:pentapeptide MXKDX repeat protein
MSKVQQVISAAVAGLGLSVAIAGCGSSTAPTKDKMGSDKMMSGDKMKDNKMSGDKMKDDKMGGDKMKDDKMKEGGK